MSIFGKLLYKLYYQPKSRKAIIKKFGGKVNYALILDCEEEMRNYALNSLVINSNFKKKGIYRINFLTGEKFIHQTLFCTYSFFKFLTSEESSNFCVYYYDDGTLSIDLIKILNNRFPQINIVEFESTMSLVQERLPKAHFPFLNHNIRLLPLFKKLIFTHLSNKGLNTFFDSDMLFLKRPDDFLNWLYKAHSCQTSAFCIQDVQRSYGYTDHQIMKIWPEGIKNNINSGMYSIHSGKMDFVFIENLIRKFETNFGGQYYLEQLITAIVLEKSVDLYIAPQSDYIVLPSYEQVKNQEGLLHHYVNESKEFYYKESWMKQLRDE